jgi:hypothetical protein
MIGGGATAEAGIGGATGGVVAPIAGGEGFELRMYVHASAPATTSAMATAPITIGARLRDGSFSNGIAAPSLSCASCWRSAISASASGRSGIGSSSAAAGGYGPTGANDG